jgi:hypothetical protein
MYINGQTDKQNAAYSYEAILFGHKDEVLIHHGQPLKMLCYVKEAGHKTTYHMIAFV